MRGAHNENVAKTEASPEHEESPRVKGQKALAFIKRHGTEIVFGAGCLALTIVCAKQGRTIELQRQLLNKKDALLGAKDWRIRDLIELCTEKDRCNLKLASAALRDGCSEGGRTLADYRYYISGQC